MESKAVNVKTIIVGAGISGISASIKFLDNAYNEFVILEADNRIGINYLFHII